MALKIRWSDEVIEMANETFGDWEELLTALQQDDPKAARLLARATEDPTSFPGKRTALRALNRKAQSIYKKRVPPLPPKVEEESAPADA